MTQEEHIKIIVGGDTTSAERTMATLPEKAKVAMGKVTDVFSRAGSHIGNSFKESFTTLLPVVSTAGAILQMKKVIGETENLKQTADALEVSTDFLQDIKNVGVAAGLADKDVTKLLDKFTQGLPSGSDVETEFYKIVDRLKDIPDPADRARVAVEAFGKGGMQLVKIAGQGSDALREMAKQMGKFSESEIKEILAADDELDKLENRVNLWSGRAVVAITRVSQVWGRFAGGIGKYDGIPGLVKGFDDALDSQIEFEHEQEQILRNKQVESRTQAEIARSLKVESDWKGKIVELTDKANRINAERLTKAIPLEDQITELMQDQADYEKGIRTWSTDALTVAKYTVALEETKTSLAEKRVQLATLELARRAAIVEMINEEVSIESALKDNFLRTSDEAAAAGDPAAQKIKQLQESADAKRKAGDSAGAEADLKQVSALRQGTYVENQSAYDNDIRTADAAKRARMPGVEHYYRNRALEMREGVKSLKYSEKYNDPFSLHDKQLAALNEKWDKIITTGGLKVLPEYSGGE